MSKLGKEILDWFNRLPNQYNNVDRSNIKSFIIEGVQDGKTGIYKLCESTDDGKVDQLALIMLLLDNHVATLVNKLEDVAEILYNNDHIYMLGILITSARLDTNSTYKVNDQNNPVSYDTFVRLVIEKSYDKPLINLFCHIYLNQKDVVLKSFNDQMCDEGKFTLGLMKNTIIERMNNGEVENE